MGKLLYLPHEVTGVGFVRSIHSTGGSGGSVFITILHSFRFKSHRSVFDQHGSDITVTIKNRKLKEYAAIADKDESGHAELEDYRPIDPVPSSKASIRPGPIQHGTPLMPYIPKSSPPPGNPNPVGFP
ncbi:hypothetical protein ACH5RR_027105 [Cinchona calisaya]|uniref:Uncharacterized protein n=1 Tax=Cinchona calisaya TaxID=153742 RepID=A0ABD2Z5H9_9GENT